MDPLKPLIADSFDTIDSIEVFDISDPDYRRQLSYLMSVSCSSVTNANTLRAYSYHLKRFKHYQLPLSKLGIELYLGRTKSATQRRMALAALRKLADLAVSQQFLSPLEYYQIRSIRQLKPHPKLGHWLTIEGARQLIQLPNLRSLTGARDGAILALLLGCGLRSAEAVSVRWANYRPVYDRPCLVDLIGKGSKPRTVPVPSWAADRLDNWLSLLTLQIGFAEIALDGPILRSFYGQTPMPSRMTHHLTTNGLSTIVRRYSQLLGIPFNSHDLRRTLAQLMRRAGVEIEQVQYILGHESVKTTELYLGGAIKLEPGIAGTDKVQWAL